MLEVKNLNLGVEINNKKVVIVDDVLYICRIVRVVIDVIIDVDRFIVI